MEQNKLMKNPTLSGPSPLLEAVFCLSLPFKAQRLAHIPSSSVTMRPSQRRAVCPGSPHSLLLLSQHLALFSLIFPSA